MAENAMPAENTVKKKKNGKKKWVKFVCLALVVALLAYFAVSCMKNKNAADTDSTELMTGVVMRGDLENAISSSGTVYPRSQYNIVPLVNEKIISCPFEEGDYVNENDVLYVFDSSGSDQIKNIRSSITSLERNISDLREDIAELTVRASASGKIENLDLIVGDTAGGRICTITDTSKMHVTLGFNAAQKEMIKKGDAVTVSISQYMTTASGYVDHIATAATAQNDGSLTYDIKIVIPNPASLTVGTRVTATVHTSQGDIVSPFSAAVSYPDPVIINARQSGEVAKVLAINGDWINEGEIIAVLESDTLSKQLENYLDDLSDRRKDLADAEDSYRVKSPISGTVLEKYYKTGDTVNSTNSTTLMVVADMSQMYFTMYVDELDVASVKMGQTVDVTADAIPGAEFSGKITKVSVIGTSQNGVTTYPIEVTIEEPGDLFPSMNVDAEVIIASSRNTLYVPLDAVSYYNGKYYVNVLNGETADVPHFGEGGVNVGELREDGEAPDFENGERPGFDGEAPHAPAGRGESQDANYDLSDTTRTEVTVGISTDTYYEILDGVKEGQIVVYTPSSGEEDFYRDFGGPRW